MGLILQGFGDSGGLITQGLSDEIVDAAIAVAARVHKLRGASKSHRREQVSNIVEVRIAARLLEVNSEAVFHSASGGVAVRFHPGQPPKVRILEHGLRSMQAEIVIIEAKFLHSRGNRG